MMPTECRHREGQKRSTRGTFVTRLGDNKIAQWGRRARPIVTHLEDKPSGAQQTRALGCGEFGAARARRPAVTGTSPDTVGLT